MTNPVLENIRRSLGRTDQTPLSLRPAIYESRQPESVDAEITLFLGEIKKLSGVGQKLSTSEIESAFRILVAEQNIRTATVWNTPHLKQLRIAEMLQNLGVELISPNANKHDMTKCDLGITEADFILPETGTIALHSSTEKSRAISLLPRVHLAIVRPDMLRADMHQVFAEAKDSNYLEPVCKIRKQEKRGDGDHSREIGSPFFITRGNASELLKPIDKAFDNIAFAIV